jgi:uncharacterized protein YcsI (UPF0317 family)
MTGPEQVASPAAARMLFRSGRRVPTAGWAPGYAQANLLAIPKDVSLHFVQFAVRNPKPCPLLDVTDPGAVWTALAPEADLRTDLPAYRVWSDGECVVESTDVIDYWRDDLVTLLLGCSFTFEQALLRAGVPVRHLEQSRNVPMFRTNLPCQPAGSLSGPMVVSMRPIPERLADTAINVTSRYPAGHGAPVHVGDPSALGIPDLSRPDFGDPVTIADDEVAMFWACGVTLQALVMSCRPSFAISHAPGHMFVTDVPHQTYEI